MRIVVVGAGPGGLGGARLLTGAGHRVEIFESRGPIGGHCYDAWQDWVMVHRYDPHCFHTDKPAVWEFVNRCAKFLTTACAVVANTRLGQIPIPSNDISAKIVGDISPEKIRDLLFVDYSAKHRGCRGRKFHGRLRDGCRSGG